MNGHIDTPGNRRQRIVVLGGGIAALACVFDLTREANWQDRFDITIYQMGWRIGGKGASGRNAARHGRIEEHGLHVWPGFYHQSFRIMRSCYRELDRPADVPVRTWRDAFRPQSHLVVQEAINQQSVPWSFRAPILPGTPGDDHASLTPRELLFRMLASIEQMVESLDTT